jgi:CheY-like chemotaxis protein
MLAYSGKGHFVLRRVQVNDLVREQARLFRAAIPKSITLNLRLAPRLPTVTADSAQVQQVVMNLITNAAEAIDGPSGAVTLTTSDRVCDAECLSRSRLVEKPTAGRYVCLQVADTGCGMDATTRERLFDPFFTTKFTGRGLGMSALLGIVRGHQGAIFVDSEIGRGAVIEVLLPADPEPADSESATATPTAAPRPAETAALAGAVLVVDDELPVRTVSTKIIETLGLKVVGAVDGQDALKRLQEHPEGLGCVLLDLTMPGMGGVATLREIQRVRPELPVILCSGYSEQEALRQIPDGGIAGFIQKPFGPAELRARIQSVLTTAETLPAAH